MACSRRKFTLGEHSVVNAHKFVPDHTWDEFCASEEQLVETLLKAQHKLCGVGKVYTHLTAQDLKIARRLRRRFTDAHLAKIAERVAHMAKELKYATVGLILLSLLHLTIERIPKVDRFERKWQVYFSKFAPFPEMSVPTQERDGTKLALPRIVVIDIGKGFDLPSGDQTDMRKLDDLLQHIWRGAGQTPPKRASKIGVDVDLGRMLTGRFPEYGWLVAKDAYRWTTDSHDPRPTMVVTLSGYKQKPRDRIPGDIFNPKYKGTADPLRILACPIVTNWAENADPFLALESYQDKTYLTLPTLAVKLSEDLFKGRPTLWTTTEVEGPTELGGSCFIVHPRAIGLFGPNGDAKPISIVDKSQLDGSSNLLKGSIVILGSLNEPDFPGDVSGLVKQAACLYTRIYSPIRIFTPIGRVVLEIIVSLLELCAITFIQYVALTDKRNLRIWRVEAAVALTGIFCVLSSSYLLARFGIMWTDAFITISLLIVSSLVYKVAPPIVRWIWRALFK